MSKSYLPPPSNFRKSDDMFILCARCKSNQWHTNVEPYVSSYHLKREGKWVLCNTCKFTRIERIEPK